MGRENEKKKAYLAGLIHDACKDMPQDEQKLLVEKSSGVCNVELETLRFGIPLQEHGM